MGLTLSENVTCSVFMLLTYSDWQALCGRSSFSFTATPLALRWTLHLEPTNKKAQGQPPSSTTKTGFSPRMVANAIKTRQSSDISRQLVRYRAQLCLDGHPNILGLLSGAIKASNIFKFTVCFAFTDSTPASETHTEALKIQLSPLPRQT